MATIIRRRKLGRTSVREICNLSQTGIRSILNDRELPSDDIYIRWGCTANVPTRNVINTAEAIHEVNNKASFRKRCADAELAPPTWLNWLEATYEGGIYPVVIRKNRHAQGRHLWVIDNAMDLQARAYLLGEGNYYISSLVHKVKEYRVFVAQGRAVWVAEKTPGNPGDVAWNVARGGRFDNVRWDQWPLKAVRTSIEAFNLSSLDFGGVDVMIDAEGNCYVLEINSAPSHTSPYRQGCTAKALDWMVQRGKERIPLIEAKGGYKKFIHPSICEAARLV